MQTVCANCQIGLKVRETGVMVLEMFMKDKEIYRIWFADVYACPGCNSDVLVNPSTLAAAQHHEKEKMAQFDKIINEYRLKAKLYYLYERLPEPDDEGPEELPF